MNYLKEMNGFMNWLETNPLSATTQALWFHLMHINNKTGWREWFTTSNTTLQAKIEITENTLIKHRKILIELKRIEYEPQGRKAGKYKLISFENPVRYEEMENCKADTPDVVLLKEESSPRAQQEVDENMKNAFELFENKTARTIGTMEVQRLGYMVDDYGEEKVMEAMKQAFRSKGNNVNLNYIEAILSNPFSQRRKEKQQYANKQQNTKYGRGDGGSHERTSGKVGSIFGGQVGRLRRKG
ncbi:DNA-binding protein [Bacillus amyloliquefaciens]|uniref:DnaD domain protein n=1 Tax=Bacillus amyloliquefaciens group TaxID=1938374 RepID=UPI000B518A70|nr:MULTISPECIES: DnaD domain protein [Bacillus amyloliquefaciens group]ASF27813.1 DNA-binding protein [Bacillus amyloliquefaciens]MDV2630768.1 DnaD domain protein [Bacillus velezensis]